MLIVGTHKDELANPEESLLEAQQVVRDFLCGMFIAKTTPIISHIQRPSEQDWFFAVDNKSRIVTDEGERVTCSGIVQLRSKLEEAIRKDTRTVIGLFVAK